MDGVNWVLTFEVLSRRQFDLDIYNDTGEIKLKGREMLPPNENGQRDMVRCPRGTVVKVIAHFDIPGKFVWHCHFLDHEDHEMMRPFEVVTGNSGPKSSKKENDDARHG